MIEPTYVKGVGMTKFDYSTKSSPVLAFEAIKKALDHADMKATDIDCAITTTVDSKNNGEKQRHSQGVIASLLKKKIPILKIPAVCGGGGVAFWNAVRMNFNNVLVVGNDRIATNTTQNITNEILMAAERVWEQEEGVNFPAENALVAQQYLNKYDATMDDLSLIAQKNHENAFNNPVAYFHKKKVTMDMINKSPVVASPLRLLDCSLSVNGAAAAILTKDKTDVKVAGSGMATDYISPFEREDMTTWRAVKKSSEIAYEQAGIGPSDINVAELHDAFTILELIEYEDLGFAKKGEGAKLIRDGITKLDGKLPVSPSGGLKAKGHPISPTGVAQIVEIVEQLRNESNDRQVTNANTGLTCNIGGAGGSITTHVFKRV